MRNNYITQLMQHLVIFVHDDLICVFIEATHQKRNRILPRLWDECRYDLDDFCWCKTADIAIFFLFNRYLSTCCNVMNSSCMIVDAHVAYFKFHWFRNRESMVYKFKKGKVSLWKNLNLMKDIFFPSYKTEWRKMYHKFKL